MTKLGDEYSNLLEYIKANKKETPKPTNQPSTIEAKPTLKPHVEQKSQGFDVGSFKRALKDQLVTEHKRRPKYRSKTHVAVGEVIGCVRKSFYSRTNVPVNYDTMFNFPYLGLIRTVGNAVHKFVQKAFKFEEVEKRFVNDKFNIKGFVDGISGGYLYEIKTVDADKFDMYDISHYNQGLVYAYILNKEYNYNINTLTIIYVRRDLKNIKSFDIKLDWRRLAPTALMYIKRAHTILDSVAHRIIPDKIGSTEKDCYWCEYKDRCEADTKQLASGKVIKLEDEPKPVKSKNKNKGKSAFLL